MQTCLKIGEFIIQAVNEALSRLETRSLTGPLVLPTGKFAPCCSVGHLNHVTGLTKAVRIMAPMISTPAVDIIKASEQPLDEAPILPVTCMKAGMSTHISCNIQFRHSLEPHAIEQCATPQVKQLWKL